MSLCNACRSFAIYLVIVLIISESPVSAFTFRRVRTTTLRPVDLTGEESALLEVNSELSKLNNERDHAKHGRDKITIRKSVNLLTSDKKVTSIREDDTNTTASPLTKQDELPKPTDDKTTTATETTTTLRGTNYTNKKRILKGNKGIVRSPSDRHAESKTSNKTSMKGEDSKIAEHNEFSTTIQNAEWTSFVTDESTGSEIIPDISTDVTSTTSIEEKQTDITKNNNEESLTITTTQLTSSSPQEEVTTDVDTPGSTRTENTFSTTDATDPTESLEGQSFLTDDSSWKKYTVIERKRLISTSKPDSYTEELANAESGTPRLSLENTGTFPTTTSERKEDEKDLSLTTQSSRRPMSSSSTQEINIDTTTAGSVESRRGGYIDYSARPNSDVPFSTETLDAVTMLNETELLSSIFEIETQEDGPEIKNISRVESQSQLADDAIKEELLKEAVLSDHVENIKRQEVQKDQEKEKPFISSENTDDSLSVKPITGKGGLYSVKTHYRKMKKIEVQPSRPFVRDPDDNSWRNESLNSLGIVFKAKNASKPFSQVLKNKTEAELNNLTQTERENTNEVPDLRQRLEKIAEVRKSRKKKIDKYGDTIYSDYEETSVESGAPKRGTVPVPVMEVEGQLFFIQTTTSNPSTQTTRLTTTPGVYVYKEEHVTTVKPKKSHKFHEYYDTTDEYDADYLNLAKIDLKKFTTRLFGQNRQTTSTTTSTMSPIFTPFAKQEKAAVPERKPTLQYFPPRPQTTTQKVNVNDYDNDFQRKVNMYAQEKPLMDVSPVTQGSPPPATVGTEKPPPPPPPPPPRKQHVRPQFPALPDNLDKNAYITFPPHVVEHAKYPASNDESFNRASYVIKHYKDLINEAVKDDYDKSGEFLPAYTEPPAVGATAARGPARPGIDEDYDYEANFRKDIMTRFVDNFNQNSERFKVDFPILYNNTVVHMKAQEDGKVVASSSAFMKRLYADGPGAGAGADAGAGAGPCEHCELKVELSPAYELHYYVPEQEEKEEAELKPATLPFNYRL